MTLMKAVHTGPYNDPDESSPTPDPTRTLMKAVHTGYRVHNSLTPDPIMSLMKAVPHRTLQ